MSAGATGGRGSSAHRPAPAAGAAAGIVDQELDRGAVDDIETDDLAGPVAADFQGRRVEHEKIFEERAQPGRKRALAIRAMPELREAVGAGARVGRGTF